MQAPHELLVPDFSKSVKGYKAEEVDAYTANLFAAYERLYIENAELSQKLVTVARKLEEYRHNEAKTAPQASAVQETADDVVRQAKEQADAILESAKTFANQYKEEVLQQVNRERVQIEALKAEAQAFRSQLLSICEKHMERIEQIPLAQSEIAASDLPPQLSEEAEEMEQMRMMEQEKTAMPIQEETEPVLPSAGIDPSDTQQFEIAKEETIHSESCGDLHSQQEQDIASDLQTKPQTIQEPTQEEILAHFSKNYIAPPSEKEDVSAGFSFGNKHVKTLEEMDQEEEEPDNDSALAKFFRKNK